jgi:hypothetical protein
MAIGHVDIRYRRENDGCFPRQGDALNRDGSRFRREEVSPPNTVDLCVDDVPNSAPGSLQWRISSPGLEL